MAEQLLGKEKVDGSIPSSGTSQKAGSQTGSKPVTKAQAHCWPKLGVRYLKPPKFCWWNAGFVTRMWQVRDLQRAPVLGAMVKPITDKVDRVIALAVIVVILTFVIGAVAIIEALTKP